MKFKKLPENSQVHGVRVILVLSPISNNFYPIRVQIPPRQQYREKKKEKKEERKTPVLEIQEAHRPPVY